MSQSHAAGVASYIVLALLVTAAVAFWLPIFAFVLAFWGDVCSRIVP